MFRAATVSALLLLGAAALASGPAFAVQAISMDEKTSGSADQKPLDKDDPQKVICKTDNETGSRLRKSKTCKTRQEWEAVYENSRKLQDGNSNETEKLSSPLPSGGG